MTFRLMTPPPEKKKPQVTGQSSPSSSRYGGSPSFQAPPYTTDDLSAAKYNKMSKRLHWIRIGLTGLITMIAIAILACSAASLQQHTASAEKYKNLLSPWPSKLDLRPTHAVLACGIITTIFGLAYMIAAFIPKTNRLHTLNLLSAAISSLTFFISLFTIIFASTISSNYASSATSGSLISWTCKWQGMEEMVPDSFSKVCNEGSAALDMVIALLVLELFAVGASAAGWWLEMRLARTNAAVGYDKSQIELVHHV